MNPATAYARADQETASRERLLVLLLERALRHMRVAATKLDEARETEAVVLLTKASDIVAELASTLDPRPAPELAVQLNDVYLFVNLRLAQAVSQRSSGPVREAERAFQPVVAAFTEAVATLQGAPATP